MSLITAVSDPTLYALLSSMYDELREPGWVINTPDHYKVVYDNNGVMAFLLVPNEDLYDSRSLLDSKPATYRKLDDNE